MEFENLDIDLKKLLPYEEKWDKIFEVRDEVNKALEIAKNENLIGHTLEAKVILNPLNEKLKNFLKENLKLLPFAFIVSQVEILDNEPSVEITQNTEKINIGITKADGKKCNRCWNYSTTVGTNTQYPDICKRCVDILSS